ncbi:leucine-rich repeat domain-containing protein [Maribacter sp. R77961]|uniref:leucine-rich repeat domain-containing protein n=1 Tax=Maribacter sp. R77961 TaxID=3093871 RepID=UPI0037C571E0
MKTIARPWKNNLKISLILYAIFITVVTGCSKEDETTAVIESIEEEVELSSEKRITSFVFLLADNPIDINVVATIDEENKIITAIMPAGTEINGLLPEIKISAQATINRNTAQDFTDALEYIITAEDGSEVIYTVKVTALLTQRQILQAILDANPDNTLGWDLQNTADLDSLNGVSTNVNGDIIELVTEYDKINEIPKEIGELSSLKSLHLEGVSLNSVPSEIGELTKLERLTFHTTGIKTIPSEIGKLANLETLDLTNNRITAIPPEIGQLTNLEILRLHTNQLTTIPPEIGQLTNLEILTLTYNRLTSLPSEISQLTSLKGLSFAENELTSLPKEMGKLTKLENLFLDNNLLTSIPSEIGFLSELEQLDIRDNQLTGIPLPVILLAEHNSLEISFDNGITISVITPLDALISIYSANPSNTLEWGVDNYPEVIFNDNGSPTNITMNNKNLTRLSSSIEHLNALETLAINNNNIESLPATMGSMNTLTVIAADRNQLSTVPKELGDLNNNFALLSITNNPVTSIPQEVCNLQVSNGGILTILTDPGEGCD